MKKQTKSIPKPTKSFGNAMSALSNLCYDYEDLNSKPKQQIPKIEASLQQNKKIQIKKEIIKKQVIKQPNITLKQPNIIFKQEVRSNGKFKLVLQKWNWIQQSNFVQSTQKIKVYSNNPEYNGTQLRVQKFIQNPNLQFLYQGDEVKQGSLGDCYLISAISCLASKPNILNRIIEYLPQNLIKQSLNFRVKLFDSGIYKQLIVKNEFPVNNLNEPMFAKSIKGDISPLIIQKAYAQLYNGYSNIQVGYSCDALRDLTGAPTQYIDIKKQEQVYKKLKESFQQHYVLTISSKATNLVDKDLIVPRHCYSIQNHKKIKYQNSEIYLIKIKNPGGSKLNKLPPEMALGMQQYLNESIIQQNGIYWLPFKVMQRNFEVISSCLLHPKYFYRYKAFSQKELSSNAASILLRINTVTHGYVSLNQIHTRHFSQHYTYDVCRIIIAKVKEQPNKQYTIQQTIVGNFGCKQTCTVQVNFSPGSYLIYLQINNIDKKISPKEIFTVNFYTSSNNFEIFGIGNISPDEMIINYIKNVQCGLQLNKSDKIIRYFGDLFGYVIIYYQNISSKTAYEQIQYQTVNVKIDQGKLEIGPGGRRLVKNLIGKQNNCSHKCQIKTRTQFR